MSPDQRHEKAHEAARKALTVWQAPGDAQACQKLRDALHALSAAGSTATEGVRTGVMKSRRPKRRKVA